MQAVATPEITSRTEAEKALRRGARLAALRAGAVAARDTAVIRAGELNKDRIERLDTELGEIKAALGKWATDNRSEFAGKQELELSAGVLAFRVGNPEVQVLKGWTVKKAIGCMVKAGKVVASWKSWVRIKFEVNRRNILSDFAAKPEDTAERLKSVGLAVTKEETFSVVFQVQAKP
jgi:phage host-nuclease inhibitor protein Gam